MSDLYRICGRQIKVEWVTHPNWAHYHFLKFNGIPQIAYCQIFERNWKFQKKSRLYIPPNQYYASTYLINEIKKIMSENPEKYREEKNFRDLLIKCCGLNLELVMGIRTDEKALHTQKESNRSSTHESTLQKEEGCGSGTSSQAETGSSSESSGGGE